jgi:type II restriction enzyme
MENILENLLTTICIKYDIPFMKQATADKVRAKWGIKVSVDKSSRRFDFGVKCDSTLYLIETNYYGGGGSKLKATAGEYKSLYDFLSKQGHGFIWITDGLGWLSTLKPLEETFYHIDHTLNLKMVTSGVLEYILVNKL